MYFFVGNVSLGQPCTNDSQCTGNEHGERCLAGKCDCKEGFELKSLQCLPGKPIKNMLHYVLSGHVRMRTERCFLPRDQLSVWSCLYRRPKLIIAVFKYQRFTYFRKKMNRNMILSQVLSRDRFLFKNCSYVNNCFMTSRNHSKNTVRNESKITILIE